jgi:hypothetical protein
MNNLNCAWWREQDSNLRRRSSADLQSAAFDRSAIPPCKHIRGHRRFRNFCQLGIVLLSITFVFLYTLALKHQLPFFDREKELYPLFFQD